MNCLVTGGAGFIGSHIVAALLRGGHDVVVLDDLSSGKRRNLDEVVARVENSFIEGCERLTFIEASLLDPDALEAAVEAVEVVFHQAAIPSVPRSFANPGATLRVNVEGTARLLQTCARLGIRRVVAASSSSVYGDTATLPKREDMVPAPKSPYALSKLADEHLCDIWAQEYGLELPALRYFNVFGPRQDPASEYAAVVPKFITRMLSGQPPTIFGDGLQSRDFTYVDDVVAANLLAAGFGVDAGNLAAYGLSNRCWPGSRSDKPTAAISGPAINVGAGERTTLLELVTAINHILGKDLRARHDERRQGDVRHSQASIEKARERLGFEPFVTLHDGLRRTVAWYVEFGEGTLRPVAEAG